MKDKKIYVVLQSPCLELGTIDFVPKKDDRIWLGETTSLCFDEYVVTCVMHHPAKNNVVVFVKRERSDYGRMLKQLKY